MKRNLAIMIALILLVVGFVGCAGEAASGPAEPEVQPNDSAPAEPSSDLSSEPSGEPSGDLSSEPSIIQFETVQIGIRLPDDWVIVRDAGTPIPYAEQTYNFTLLPPDGESIGIVTIGTTQDREPLADDDFYSWLSTRVNQFLPRAAEDTAVYTQLMLNNGSGVYSVLTDADLVGTVPQPDEYMYIGMFFGNWDNCAIAYATLLTNDKDGFYFNLMLLSLALMDISLV